MNYVLGRFIQFKSCQLERFNELKEIKEIRELEEYKRLELKIIL
jgi:hypothetical protein